MKDGIPWRVRKAAADALKAEAKRVIPQRRVVPDNHNPHERRGIVPWTPGRIWDGETVVIVGGGPSLKDPVHLQALRDTQGRSKCIVVNQSFEIAPWADLLFFADSSWFQWNRQVLIDQWPKSKPMVTATSDTGSCNDIAAKRTILRMWRDRNRWSTDPRKVHGWDGGTMACNLAFHLGAKRIVLFGIDLTVGPKGETQWHTKHKRKTAAQNYARRFIPTWKNAVIECRAAGVEVLRATPGTDIGAPLRSFDELFPVPAEGFPNGA